MSQSTVVTENTMESNSALNEHMLFGGSFSAILPAGFQDVSEVRQIPDNQEVFIHTRTDQSIIMELMEFQKDVPDADAARYHFEDIASTNGAGSQGTSEVLSVEPIPKSQLALAECQTAWFLTGRQMVSKFNEQSVIFVGLRKLGCFLVRRMSAYSEWRVEPGSLAVIASQREKAKNTVNIYMCLYRLPQFTTDILLTFNDPSAIDPTSSSAATQSSSVQQQVPAWSLEHFRVFSQTLRLRNPQIFG